MTPPSRVTGFIEAQPDALDATLREVPAAVARLGRASASYREVVLTGSGTSKHALLATAATFRRAHGCPTSVLGPTAFLEAPPFAAPAEVLVVALSQTGTSTTTVAALERAQKDGHPTIAVTAEAESAFARAAERLLVLPIGPEAIGPKTKGYTASLLALLALAEGTAPSEPASVLPDDRAAYVRWFARRLPDWLTLGRGWAHRFVDVDHVMLVGDETHVATALEASLKLQEMAGASASAHDLEEALHGRFHGLGPADLAVFVCAEGRAVREALHAADVLSDLGVGTLVIGAGGAETPEANGGLVEAGASGPRDLIAIAAGPGPDPATELAPVSAIVPFQAFAERLAILRDVDPDAMRYPGLSGRLSIKLPPA